jgi:long-chain acyl-CoA synthetase
VACLAEGHVEMTSEIEQGYIDKGDTWPKTLRHNYQVFGDSRIAMRHKHHGIWQPHTWKDYYLGAKYLALGLASLGFEMGDKVLIVGDNAPQWYHAELATQANRGASVGLYSELSPAEIRYIAQDSEARFAAVEDQEQVDKFLEIKEELPLLEKVIYWSYKGLAHYDDPILMGYRELLRLGRAYEEEHPELFEQNVDAGRPDDVCAIVYTSGTTGAAPKGAVHTHRTLRANVGYLLDLDPWHESDDVVPYMPPAWMTEQCFGIGCHLLSGSILNFAEGPETQQQDAREIGPSILYHGARYWENQAAMVQARIQGSDALKRFTFRSLMPIGHRIADAQLAGEGTSLPARILYALANGILFRPLKDVLGLSNARVCYATETMLSPDALRFYHALNLPLKSLYGSAEGGAIAGHRTDAIRTGTVGAVHEGVEVRITDDAELLCRHPGTFIGYYRDPDRTAGVLTDGWVSTGDSGFIAEDGHLVLVDRLDDIVKLTSGDKLAPQSLESRLRFSPFIRDAWVLAGPDGAYVSVIIIIDYDRVGRWAGQRKMSYATFTELSQQPEVYELVKRDIDRVNRNLPPGLRIKKYVNLHKELDPDEGELTRTRKLRRAFMEQRYRELVTAIYGDQTEVPVEAEVRYRDGRMRATETTIGIESIEEVGP